MTTVLLSHRMVAVGEFMDHTFKLFADGRLHQSINAHSDVVTCFACSDDGCEWLIVACGPCCRLDFSCFRPLASSPAEWVVIAAPHSKDTLMSGSASGELFKWALAADGSIADTCTPAAVFRGHHRSLTSVALSSKFDVTASSSAVRTAIACKMESDVVTTKGYTNAYCASLAKAR